MINIKSDTLATKYRPKKLSEFIGQNEVRNKVKGILATQQIPTAIMIIGPSGVGKTTLSRLIVRYLNCDTGDAEGDCNSCRLMDENQHPDYDEVNGSESGNIEKVRSLIKQARLSPRFSMRVICVDEVQRASHAAFQALLKPVEETPENTLWIFCTTDPEKIPKALMGRCIILSLGLPSKTEIAKRVYRIAKEEEFEWITKNACLKIAESSAGHVRNAIQTLQSISAYIKGSDEKITAKKLDTLIDNISLEVSDIDTDKLVLRLLAGIYGADTRLVNKVILDTSDYYNLISRALNAHYHILGINEVGRHKNLWETKFNRALNAALKDRGYNSELAYRVHSELTSLMSRLKEFTIDGQHLCIQYLIPLCQVFESD